MNSYWCRAYPGPRPGNYKVEVYGNINDIPDHYPLGSFHRVVTNKEPSLELMFKLLNEKGLVQEDNEITTVTLH